MTKNEIKTAIKNDVDDQTITAPVLNQWIAEADNAVQTWKPKDNQNQTFDWWDFLKDQKPYSSQANIQKYALPDDYRAFIEFKVGDDTEPYKIIDFRDREKHNDHVFWILGKYFYIKGIPAEDGQTMTLVYVRFTDDLGDTDEPEIEKIYHHAYTEYGKKKYYALQGDTELENKAEANFENIMMKKWRDQELSRMQSASDTAEINSAFIV